MIESVNPNYYSCDVRTEDGHVLTGVAVPGLIQDSVGSGGNVWIPRSGELVLVQTGTPTANILKVIPTTSDLATAQETTYSVGESSAAPVETEAGQANYRGRMPANLNPGDWVRIGNQGQMVAVLDGGVAQLMGSPWARVRAIETDDTLQLYGRNFSLQTGMGNLNIRDEGGKQSLLFQGGTDQSIETGDGRENWTVQYAIGGQRRGLVDFRTRDRQGNAMCRTTIGEDGSLEQEIVGGYTLAAEGSAYIMYGEGRRTTLQSGDDEVNVNNGNRTVRVTGELDTEASNSLRLVSMGGRIDSSENNWIMTANQTMDVVIGGNKLAVAGVNALTYQVANGSVLFEIGKSITDLKTANSGFKVATYAPLGNIELSTIIPGSIVKIGSTTVVDGIWLGAIPTAGPTGALFPAPPPFHGVKYETLAAYLISLEKWLDGFYAWAASHVHGAYGGPTTSPLVPLNATLPTNATATHAALRPPIMSQIVRIGV